MTQSSVEGKAIDASDVQASVQPKPLLRRSWVTHLFVGWGGCVQHRAIACLYYTTRSVKRERFHGLLRSKKNTSLWRFRLVTVCSINISFFKGASCPIAYLTFSALWTASCAWLSGFVQNYHYGIQGHFSRPPPYSREWYSGSTGEKSWVMHLIITQSLSVHAKTYPISAPWVPIDPIPPIHTLLIPTHLVQKH